MTPRSPSAAPTKGFSLVELMVVLAILAVFLMMAAPSLQEAIDNQRMKGAATDLMIALTRARSEAITRNTNVTLSPKAGGWANGWQLPDPATGTLLEDHAAVTGISISGPASVVYQGSGRIQGAAAASFSVSGTITTATRCVAVDLSGRPNVKVGTC